MQSGKSFVAADENGLHQYAADHSGNGLGNVVHRATSALGMERCTPCAKRQAQLNGMFRRR